MNRVLIVLLIAAAIVVAAWCGAFAIGTVRGTTAAREPWPAGLGSVESVGLRYRPHGTSSAALRLGELAQPLAISFAKNANPASVVRARISDFVDREQSSAVARTGTAPAEVVAHLDAHAAQIDAVRDHLLHAGVIAWDFDPSRGLDAPIPNLLGHMHLAKLLIARALVRRDWEDLHAVRNLERSLEERPELITQLIVLAIARMLNGAAWKMPAPPPPWLAELHRVDHRLLIARGLQYDAWLFWAHGDESLDGVLAMLSRPYARYAMADVIRNERETTSEIMAMQRCTIDGEAYFRLRLESLPEWNVMARLVLPNIGSTVQRVLRYEVEREATANVMRVLQRSPIVITSRCADGQWRYDGRTLAFTADLPPVGNRVAMPLALHLRE